MPQDKPNILLITTDQQRFDTCGPDAPPFMRTPHFNLLSHEGIRFTRAYADCPLCVPMRVSIMTGKHPWTHGMMGNGKSSDVMDREGTLPTLLREQAYQTAAIGKMHFSPQRVRHGFDEMIIPDDYYRQMKESGNPLQPMRSGLGQNEVFATMGTVPESMTLTSWIAEQSLEYIRDRRDPTLPFFLWCSFSKPHPPLDPPEPYYSMYRNCEIPEPVYGDWCDDEHCPEPIKRHRQQWFGDLLRPEIIREGRSAYYGLITQIDYNIGRIFAALQDALLFDDTLIVYTSDHGELLGDHRCIAKTWFFEGASHIPFVLRLPKSWEDRRHGTSCEGLVVPADILPTLLTAAGGTPPDDVDGLNLIAIARGQSPPRRYLEARFDCAREFTYLAITDGAWKYIYYPEGAAEQLFDLQTDPKELKNLASLEEFDPKRSELRAELIRRCTERGEDQYVKDGELISWDLIGDTEVDRRNRSWPGFHTETSPVDVRH